MLSLIFGLWLNVSGLQPTADGKGCIIDTPQRANTEYVTGVSCKEIAGIINQEWETNRGECAARAKITRKN